MKQYKVDIMLPETLEELLNEYIILDMNWTKRDGKLYTDTHEKDTIDRFIKEIKNLIAHQERGDKI